MGAAPETRKEDAVTTTPTAREASDKMLAKIRGLLAQAENRAATKEESEAFAAKATELMAKYGVDRMMLTVDDPTSDVLGDRIVDITGNAALNRQRQDLLARVAMAMGAKAVLTRRFDWTKGKQGAEVLQVHLFGFGADLERIEMLYTSLLVQALNGVARATIPEGEWPATFRRSWLQGFTQIVVMRIQQAERRARGEADAQRNGGMSTDLVLVDRRDQIERRAAEVYPRLGKTRGRSLSGSGYRSGAQAGQNADIGANRVGGNGRGAISS